jgi:hypothetical protein
MDKEAKAMGHPILNMLFIRLLPVTTVQGELMQKDKLRELAVALTKP